MKSIKKRYLISVLLFSLYFISGCFAFTIGPWEDGKIPYYLTGDFSEDEVAVIEEAMLTWEGICNVKFEKVNPMASAYHIIRLHEYVWTSSIGENNAECFMYFGDGYNELEHSIHELGHCLGLVHEHQRPDRDNYVLINWNKIYSVYHHNFEIIENPLIEEQSYPYDYESIMHYPINAFSRDGSVTIDVLDGSVVQRNGISPFDAQKVQDIYGLPE